MLQTLVRATGCHCVRRHSLSPGITAVPVNAILLKGIMSQYIGKPLDIIKREYEAQREVGISDGAAGEDGREVPGSSLPVPKVCGISDEQFNFKIDLFTFKLVVLLFLLFCFITS